MEIRERKNPREMFGTLDNNVPHQIPVTGEDLNSPRKKSISRDQFNAEKWDYPMKPAFFSEFDVKCSLYKRRDVSLVILCVF